MSFLYYAPGRVGPGPVPKELAYAFEQDASVADIHKGPDGKGGSLLFAHSFKDTPQLVRYEPGHQTWRKVPGTEFWVGRYTDSMPPERLARKQQIKGHWAKLGDGHNWLIPIARCFVPDLGRWAIGLPTKMELDEDGNWQPGQVVPRCRGLWEIAERWFDNVELDNNAPVLKTEAYGMASKVIGANYRVSAVEVAMLELIDDEIYPVVMAKTWDEPIWRAHHEKKTAEALAVSAFG